MENNVENTEVVAENTVAVAATNEKKEAEATIQDVERQYFSPDELEKGVSAVQVAIELATKAGAKPIYNFDPNADFPAGCGLAIIPISKRDKEGERGNIVENVAIAAVPEPSTIAALEGGNQWIYDTLVSALIGKVANAVRPRGEKGTTAGTIPSAPIDFITSQRTSGESLTAWRELCNKFVSALRKKGLVTVNAQTLRQILQSKEFAESIFPKVKQEVWVNVLDAMIARAEKDKMEPGILKVWKETRDSTSIEVPELDVSDLNNL